MFFTQDCLWNCRRFWHKPWNAYVYLHYDKFNRSVWFVFMYLFAEPCKHHSPVAYNIMFKHFFWTHIFTRVSLIFPLQVIIIIFKTEWHMVPQLNKYFHFKFTQYSIQTTFVYSVSLVTALLWLFCVTGYTGRLHYCTKSKQFNYDTLLVIKKKYWALECVINLLQAFALQNNFA